MRANIPRIQSALHLFVLVLWSLSPSTPFQPQTLPIFCRRHLLTSHYAQLPISPSHTPFPALFAFPKPHPPKWVMTVQGFMEEVAELTTISKARATTNQIEEHGKSWESKFVWTTSFTGFRTFFPILLPGNQLSTSNCTQALLRSRRIGVCPRLE